MLQQQLFLCSICTMLKSNPLQRGIHEHEGAVPSLIIVHTLLPTSSLLTRHILHQSRLVVKKGSAHLDCLQPHRQVDILKPVTESTSAHYPHLLQQEWSKSISYFTHCFSPYTYTLYTILARTPAFGGHTCSSTALCTPPNFHTT